MASIQRLLVLLALAASAATASDVAPKIQKPIAISKNILSGHNVRVLCSVEAGSQPLRFSWLVNELPAEQTAQLKTKSQSDSFSMLELTPASATHTGNYTCTVRNQAGEDSVQFELLVKGIQSSSTDPTVARVTQPKA